MTLNSLNYCDILLIINAVLCVLLTLAITMPAKILHKGRRAESSKEKKEENQTIGATLEIEEPANGVSFDLLVREQKETSDYESLFIQDAGITARTGKSVYIRKEHHDKIMKIVRVIGKNRISLFSYIDHVLSHHLADYQDEITELYNKNNEAIF